MKWNLTPFHFKELILKGYSLDQMFLLKMLHEQLDISDLVKESAKIAALQQSLIRKGLITETEDKLTTLGTELLVFMDSKESKKIERKKTDTSKFDEWWKEFPSTDTFEHKGKLFSGCRNLRQGKDDCRVKFDKILLEGEYSAQILIDALRFDILNKKENSLKTGTNKLTYLQNSLTYLNQRSYEGSIDLIQQGIVIDESFETRRSGTDI